jgi:hypothetical protein
VVSGKLNSHKYEQEESSKPYLECMENHYKKIRSRKTLQEAKIV